MARRHIRASLLGLALCSLFSTLGFSQEVTPSYPKSDEIRARYGFAEWPGATGPVYAGLDLTALDLSESKEDGWALQKKPFMQVVEIKENDPYRKTKVSGYGVRVQRHLERKGLDPALHLLSVRWEVASDRAGARTLLLNEFLSHHSVPPAAAPALPWGETRENGLGDVAFVHRKGAETHRIVFVRGNLFVRIDALGEGTRFATQLAQRIDQSILKGPKASRYSALERPKPVQFELEESDQLSTPRALMVEVEPKHRALWIASHGDLVRNLRAKGDWGYIARKPGPLRLIVVDERGCFGLYEQTVSQ